MITTSTDVSVVATQLTGWSLLLFLGDLGLVLNTTTLVAIMAGGTALTIDSALQLGSRSYFSST